MVFRTFVDVGNQVTVVWVLELSYGRQTVDSRDNAPNHNTVTPSISYWANQWLWRGKHTRLLIIWRQICLILHLDFYLLLVILVQQVDTMTFLCVLGITCTQACLLNQHTITFPTHTVWTWATWSPEVESSASVPLSIPSDGQAGMAVWAKDSHNKGKLLSSQLLLWVGLHWVLSLRVLVTADKLTFQC